MLNQHFSDLPSRKKGKRRLFFVFITFCLIILCTGDSLLLAQNDLTKVRINLVNFLYIIDGGYSSNRMAAPGD